MITHTQHNNESVSTKFSIVDVESTPTLPELLHFQAGDCHINIPREVGTKYHNLGAQLLLESENAERINCKIFQEWLDGKGRRPTSWGTLVKVLNDIEMGELASKIEANLI